MSVSGTATIQNEAGIHCRPSTHIIKSVESYAGSIRVRAESGESDLRSMLSLMMLGLTQGTRVQVEVEGPDEEKQLADVIGMLETEYDFPQ
jgi:phosphotransferase system HPr (HPr) family protein